MWQFSSLSFSNSHTIDVLPHKCIWLRWWYMAWCIFVAFFRSFLLFATLIALSRMKLANETPPTIIILRLMCAFFLSNRISLLFNRWLVRTHPCAVYIDFIFSTNIATTRFSHSTRYSSFFFVFFCLLAPSQLISYFGFCNFYRVHFYCWFALMLLLLMTAMVVLPGMWPKFFIQ